MVCCHDYSKVTKSFMILKLHNSYSGSGWPKDIPRLSSSGSRVTVSTGGLKPIGA